MSTFRKRACTSTHLISKPTLINYFDIGSKTRTYLESFDNWDIDSFDPQRKEVCISFETDTGNINHMTFILEI